MEKLINYLKTIINNKILITESELLYIVDLKKYVNSIYFINNINDNSNINIKSNTDVIFLCKLGAITNNEMEIIRTIKKFIEINDPSIKYHIISISRESMTIKNELFLDDLSTQVSYFNLNIPYIELNKKLFLMTTNMDLSDVCAVIKRLKNNISISNITKINVLQDINELLVRYSLLEKDLSFDYENIVIVDRRYICKESINLLLTSRKFEGIISEFYNIKYRYAIINNKEIYLNLECPIYSKLYNLDISDIPETLNKYAKYLKEIEDKIKSETKMLIINREITNNLSILVNEKRILSEWIDITDTIFKNIKQSNYMKKLEIEDNVINNINKNESIRYISELIDRNTDIIYIYRLLILMCKTNYINNNELEDIKKDILQSFGHKEIFVMNLYLNKLLEIEKNKYNEIKYNNNIIFFIGGCTYSELDENNIIYTDKIINGSEYIKQLIMF